MAENFQFKVIENAENFWLKVKYYNRGEKKYATLFSLVPSADALLIILHFSKTYYSIILNWYLLLLLVKKIYGKVKNLERRKCVRGGCSPPSTITLLETQPLGHRAICKASSYTKNEYNLFYQKLDAEYFFIQQIFWKKQYFPRKTQKTVLTVHLIIF